MVMLPHMYRVKYRHDRAVDYLNNDKKRKSLVRYIIAGVIILVFALIQFLT
jgi:hypothetical protein